MTLLFQWEGKKITAYIISPWSILYLQVLKSVTWANFILDAESCPCAVWHSYKTFHMTQSHERVLFQSYRPRVSPRIVSCVYRHTPTSCTSASGLRLSVVPHVQSLDKSVSHSSKQKLACGLIRNNIFFFIWPTCDVNLLRKIKGTIRIFLAAWRRICCFADQLSCDLSCFPRDPWRVPEPPVGKHGAGWKPAPINQLWFINSNKINRFYSCQSMN